MKKNDIRIAFIYLLLNLSLLSAVSNSIQYLGLFCIIFIFIYCIIHLFNNSKINFNTKNKIILSFIPYLLFNILNLILNFSLRGIYHISIYIVVIIFSSFIILFGSETQFNPYIKKIAKTSIFIGLILVLIQEYTRFLPITLLHANVIAIFLLLNFLNLLKNIYPHHLRQNAIYIFLSFIAIFLSSSRATLITLMLITLIFIIWPKLSKTKFNFISFIFIFLLTIGLFTYIYPNLNLLYPNFYASINEISQSLTGKNFFSGRNILWYQVISVIRESYLLGFGPGVLMSDFYDTTYSAHSLYMQIILQNGIIGLSFFMCIFVSLFKYTSKHLNSKNTKYIIAGVLGILLHQTFEVSLIQNQLSIGLLMWYSILSNLPK